MKRNAVVGMVAACAIGSVLGLGEAALARGDGNDNGKDAPPASVMPDFERAGMPADLWDRQSRLAVVAGRIEDLVDPTESGRPTRSGMDGYLLVKIDLEMNAVELFWKGEIPGKVRKVIAAHPDVQVRIHHTAYSEIGYMDSQDALVKVAKASVAKAGGNAQLLAIQHVGDREGFQVFLFDPDRQVSVRDLLRDYARTGLLDLPIHVEFSREKPTSPALSAYAAAPT